MAITAPCSKSNLEAEDTVKHQYARCCFFAVAISAVPFSGQAYTQKTLHSFCTESNCGDGQTPETGLLADSSGALYGASEEGGEFGEGLVFKLIPNAKKTKYTEHILKNFCKSANCADGALPYGDLIMDVDGDLYGTTDGGGKYGDGAVFKMKPVTNGWSFSIIHSFCAKTNCADGIGPETGLAYAGQASGAPYDGSSPLYGTTTGGGANNKGIAYELKPNGSGWTYSVIHSFNAPSADSTAFPGPLLLDMSGNVLGVTGQGGKYGVGEIYRLKAGSWTEAVLHNFTAATGQVGWGRLSMDAAGNLFGVTAYGGSGTHCTADAGCGVAYERTAGGDYKVLYQFCSKANCNDGASPLAGMTLDADGNLFGTTYTGGSGGGGTAFELSHGSKWALTILYPFCSAGSCADGEQSATPLTLDNDGNLYGTTTEEGANGSGGTVFRLRP
jgi:uncharacterized repeat protein (TIGR03803 family)